MHTIEINHLNKAFHHRQVLIDINLQVNAGETIAIIGPSGSGKTTLLRCLNFLEVADSGIIRVGNTTIDTHTIKKQCQAIRQLRQQIGFVFQNFNLFPHLTVLQNLIEGPLFVKRMSRTQAIALGSALLDKVGLIEKASAFPNQLSGGQQQRVAIARALAMQPQVILFDEPTSALDPELVKEVLNVISTLAREKKTMIIVTHEIKFAQRVANRVIFMDAGHIVEESSASQLFTHPKHPRLQQFLNSLTITESDF